MIMMAMKILQLVSRLPEQKQSNIKKGLNPFDDNDRQKAAKGIADIADSVVGEIGQYKWNIALRRLYQLTSEMRMSVGDNGNTISFIIGGNKSKQGLG